MKNRVVTIQEATQILGITKQGVYMHIRNGLKVHYSPNRHHASRITGEHIITTTLEDMREYFVKQYKANKRHAEKHIASIFNAMQEQ